MPKKTKPPEACNYDWHRHQPSSLLAQSELQLSPSSRFFSGEQVVISDLVLVELYLLLRNPIVLKKPLTSSAAAKLVQSYFSHANVKRAESAPIMDQVWACAAKPNFARRRIIDIRLALTLQHHGVTHFATANTKDFKNLGFEKVWNPLN